MKMTRDVVSAYYSIFVTDLGIEITVGERDVGCVLIYNTSPGIPGKLHEDRNLVEDRGT
jgi:hypothetical protein